MKNVLITGISRGIGKALAEKFLDEGYFVIGTSINGSTDFSNENLKVFKLDLSNSESITECSVGINNLNIKTDILINNAGVILDDGETVLNADNLRDTLEINLIGTADFAEKIIPIMNIDSHIVFISSSAGSITETDYETHSHHPNQYPAYKISKAAINMYMRTLAMRLKDKIKVSSIHPGWVKTDMGGEDAPMLPEEAAQYIFSTATDKNIETGKFWFKGENYSW